MAHGQLLIWSLTIMFFFRLFEISVRANTSAGFGFNATTARMSNVAGLRAKQDR